MGYASHVKKQQKSLKSERRAIAELASSMGRVIPIAATLGVAQEELFAGFATLTGVTGNTAEVSTQLASVLTAMMKPTEAMAAAVKELALSAPTMPSCETIASDPENPVIGTTDGSAEAVGKLLGRKEALTAAFALTGSQADVFTEKLGKVRSASAVPTL